MKTKQIYIYCIYFPTSNKYYVGQTAYLEKRMQQHLCSGSLVCKALYKYDDWQVEILHTCKTRDEANKIEIEEIRHYNCIVPNGYNITRGGEGTSGYKHTEVAIEKMCGNQYAKGHKHTEQWKKAQSERKKGRKSFGSGGKGQKKPGTSLGLQGNKNAQGYKHTEEWKQNKSKEMQDKKESEETRKRKSVAMLGNKNGMANKNKKHSEKTKAKIRRSLQGKKASNKSKIRRSITCLKKRIINLEVEV